MASSGTAYFRQQRLARTGGLEEHSFRLGLWRVDPVSRDVFNGALRRRLSPRAMRALLVLAEADGAVVKRDELFHAIWPDVTVCEESLTAAIAELRRTLDDKAGPARLIETVHKSGYRLKPGALRRDDIEVLSHGAHAGGFSLDAYMYCLEARRTVARGSLRAYERSAELTLAAVEAGPEFAMAHAEYALALVFEHLYVERAATSVETACHHAHRALELDPNLSIGHTALGFMYGALGLAEDSRNAFSRAIACDPNDGIAHYLCAASLFACGDYLGATTMGERGGVLIPEDYRSLYVAARAAVRIDPERAVRNASLALDRVDENLRHDPGQSRAQMIRAALLNQVGRKDDAAAALAQNPGEHSLMDFFRFVAASELGELDVAVEAFESVTDQGWWHAGWVASEPALPRIANERRFRRRAQALGLR